MRIRSLAFAATAAGAVVAVATMGVSAQGPEMKMDAPTKAVVVAAAPWSPVVLHSSFVLKFFLDRGRHTLPRLSEAM